MREYRRTKDPVCLEQGNLLIAYTKNLHNFFDLDNYLYYKSVNGFDWIRAIYFGFMTYTNFTNHYRYDHILRRPDLVYEYEKLKISLNLAYKNPNNSKLYKYNKIYETIVNVVNNKLS